MQQARGWDNVTWYTNVHIVFPKYITLTEYCRLQTIAKYSSSTSAQFFSLQIQRYIHSVTVYAILSDVHQYIKMSLSLVL